MKLIYEITNENIKRFEKKKHEHEHVYNYGAEQ